MSKRQFGNVGQLPSGKWRARYTAPTGDVVSAPTTYYSKDDAIGWLRGEQKLIEFGEWTHPRVRAGKQKTAMTVGGWVNQWLELRSRGVNPLKPSTRLKYREVLDGRVLEVSGAASALRDIPLGGVTRKDVAHWWDSINEQFDSPSYNQNAYNRLKTAFSAAIDRELMEVNPCTVKAASARVKPARKELPPVEVMHGIVKHLDHSNKRTTGDKKLIAILTLFHGVRIGEVLAFQRKTVIDRGESISFLVRRTAYRDEDNKMKLLDTPKTDAGYREVPIFPQFFDDVRFHLKHFVGSAPSAQLFTNGKGEILPDETARASMNRAKRRAGYDGVKITPHYGRVWLITSLSEAGMQIPQIGAILGQVDLKTITEVYMRATAGRSKEALEIVARDVIGDVP